jgi:hypothetical protein
LVWASARSKGIDKCCARGIHLVGYTSKHKVGETRESHTLYVDVNKASNGRFILPRGFDENFVYSSNAVKSFFSSHGDLFSPGDYPEEVICGPDMQDALFGNNSRIFYQTHIHDASTRIGRVESSDLEEVISFFDDKSVSSNFPGSEYIEMDVLSDKTDAIRSFSKIGFEVCAFFPGWHYDPKTELRYDTVRLAKFLNNATAFPLDKCMELKIASLKKGFIVL